MKNATTPTNFKQSRNYTVKMTVIFHLTFFEVGSPAADRKTNVEKP
jgi:hypothetical protein